MRPRIPTLLRRGLAISLLFVVGASLAVTLSRPELERRSKLFLRSARGETIPAAEQTRYWFDPAYAAFVEDVRRKTPENATVAVLVPRRPDAYTSIAVYVLAPRRVVDGARAGEAAFIATYRTETGPGGEPIAQGLLWRR